MHLLINNNDNSVNWANNEWDDHLNTEGTTRHELPGTVEENIPKGLTIHDMEWNGKTLVQSEISKYIHSKEHQRDSETMSQRLADGMSEAEAREGLFLNAPEQG